MTKEFELQTHGGVACSAHTERRLGKTCKGAGRWRCEVKQRDEPSGSEERRASGTEGHLGCKGLIGVIEIWGPYSGLSTWLKSDRSRQSSGSGNPGAAATPNSFTGVRPRTDWRVGKAERQRGELGKAVNSVASVLCAAL